METVLSRLALGRQAQCLSIAEKTNGDDPRPRHDIGLRVPSRVLTGTERGEGMATPVRFNARTVAVRAEADRLMQRRGQALERVNSLAGPEMPWSKEMRGHLLSVSDNVVAARNKLGEVGEQRLTVLIDDRTRLINAARVLIEADDKMRLVEQKIRGAERSARRSNRGR